MKRLLWLLRHIRQAAKSLEQVVRAQEYERLRTETDAHWEELFREGIELPNQPKPGTSDLWKCRERQLHIDEQSEREREEVLRETTRQENRRRRFRMMIETHPEKD